jgi:hypothetical protein
MKMSRASSLARPHGTNPVFAAKARFRRQGQSSSKVVFAGARNVAHALGTAVRKKLVRIDPGGAPCITC